MDKIFEALVDTAKFTAGLFESMSAWFVLFAAALALWCVVKYLLTERDSKIDGDVMKELGTYQRVAKNWKNDEKIRGFTWVLKKQQNCLVSVYYKYFMSHWDFSHIGEAITVAEYRTVTGRLKIRVFNWFLFALLFWLAFMNVCSAFNFNSAEISKNFFTGTGLHALIVPVILLAAQIAVTIVLSFYRHKEYMTKVELFKELQQSSPAFFGSIKADYNKVAKMVAKDMRIKKGKLKRIEKQIEKERLIFRSELGAGSEETQTHKKDSQPQKKADKSAEPETIPEQEKSGNLNNENPAEDKDIPEAAKTTEETEAAEEMETTEQPENTEEITSQELPPHGKIRYDEMTGEPIPVTGDESPRQEFTSNSEMPSESSDMQYGETAEQETAQSEPETDVYPEPEETAEETPEYQKSAQDIQQIQDRVKGAESLMSDMRMQALLTKAEARASVIAESASISDILPAPKPRPEPTYVPHSPESVQAPARDMQKDLQAAEQKPVKKVKRKRKSKNKPEAAPAQFAPPQYPSQYYPNSPQYNSQMMPQQPGQPQVIYVPQQPAQPAFGQQPYGAQWTPEFLASLIKQVKDELKEDDRERMARVRSARMSGSDRAKRRSAFESRLEKVAAKVAEQTAERTADRTAEEIAEKTVQFLESISSGGVMRGIDKKDTKK